MSNPCFNQPTTLARRRVSRQILRTMPLKRQPTPEEIDALADEFRKRRLAERATWCALGCVNMRWGSERLSRKDGRGQDWQWS